MQQSDLVERLLPCPFCGGQAELRKWDFPYERHQVRCSVCKAEGSPKKAIYGEAVDAWNTRTTTNDAPVERLVKEAVSTIYGVAGDADGDNAWEALQQIQMLASNALAALSSPSGEPAVGEAKAYCNKCGFYGVPDDQGNHKRPRDGETCNYTATAAKPTTNTADTPPASGLVEAAQAVLDAADDGRCFGGGVAWGEALDNLRAALTTAPTAPVGEGADA